MKQTLPAGEYYIGDPCYVIDHDLWSEFCDALDQNNRDHGVFEFRGHKCFVSSTNVGDGIYYDQMHREYSVDAGIIGAIPMALVTQDYKGVGHKFVTTYDFDVDADDGRWEDQKRIYVGAVVIIT